MQHKPPVLLSIAGSDSSAGAGVQADIKTCIAHNVYCATVITATTAQNTLGVEEVMTLKPSHVHAQCQAVLKDLSVDVIKIGLLGCEEIIREVASVLSALGKNKPPVILDPVMGASTGKSFVENASLSALRTELLPLCDIITPNIAEAERLLERPIGSRQDMEEAVKECVSLSYGQVAIITGGEGLEDEACDVMFKDGSVTWFEGDYIDSPNNHGTGCVFSTALACRWVKGASVEKAVIGAKKFIKQNLIANKEMKIGQGAGPLLTGFIK